MAAVGEDQIRPVTFLFADIVGSTSLGERLSADEVKALVGECVTRMSRAVEEYGGRIQAYMGDGICAFFGVPVAHEDDPERAARAGLRILDVVNEYSEDVEQAWGIQDFNIRIGINTGRAAVGLVGGLDSAEVALGDVANVAARLQSTAEPGTICVGDATARQLADRFALAPLGPQQLKGRDEPVTAWRLEGRLATDSEPPPPLIGRDAELARLQHALDELTRSGRGQVLLLTGETGIGKSRLLEELEGLVPDNVTWLQGHCLSYGGHVAWPFVEILRHWLRIEEGEGNVVVRTRAQARLGGLLGDRAPEVLPHLARLLGLALDPSAPQLAGSSEELAEGIRTAYSEWIEALADRGPIVLAIEDVHWADAPARELAERLLALLDRYPILIVATLRLDASSEGGRFRLRALGEYPHRVAELPLAPLSPEDAGRLAEAIAEGPIDPAARALIVERAEGNALYVEELVRSFQEGAAVTKRSQFTVSLPTAALLPPALENVLVARIDSLDEGPREVAQAAAIVGRRFSRRVLDRVVQRDDLDESLAALLRADVIREAGGGGDREYVFRHGLFQDAALSTLTSSGREQFYARVAVAVEDVFIDSHDGHLEMLAHYYAQSRDLPKSLHYLEQAGEKAAALGAAGRAAELWGRARNVAVRAGDEEARERLDARLTQIEGS